MQITKVPFVTMDWAQVERTTHEGEHEVAYWRTQLYGSIRVRMIDYPAGYLADHWCRKGHIVLCLQGELHTELRDGRKFMLRSGMSYQVANDDGAHRSSTLSGATIFVVD
jgi:very-short-patch-repair endonuclease